MMRKYVLLLLCLAFASTAFAEAIWVQKHKAYRIDNFDSAGERTHGVAIMDYDKLEEDPYLAETVRLLSERTKREYQGALTYFVVAIKSVKIRGTDFKLQQGSMLFQPKISDYELRGEFGKLRPGEQRMIIMLIPKNFNLKKPVTFWSGKACGKINLQKLVKPDV